MEVTEFYNWCDDNFEDFEEYDISLITQFNRNWLSVIIKNRTTNEIYEDLLLEKIIESMYNLQFNNTNQIIIIQMFLDYINLLSKDYNHNQILKTYTKILYYLKISEYLNNINELNLRDTYINLSENIVEDIITQHNLYDFDFERPFYKTNFVRKLMMILYYHYNDVISYTFMEGFKWKYKALQFIDKTTEFYDFMLSDFIGEILEYSLENNLFLEKPLRDSVREINNQKFFPYEDEYLNYYKNELNRLIQKYPNNKYYVNDLNLRYSIYIDLVK